LTGSFLAGKTAFVTGSTRGIGWAAARMLARHGANVVLNGKSDRELLDRRIAEIRDEFGVTATGFCADAGDIEAVRGCYREIFQQFKRLDVLVNNAGILEGALLGMITDALIKRNFEINTFGSIYHLQEASRLMARNKNGSIINLTSILGRVGSEGQAVYSASKAAIIGLTLSAAKELASKNIRVNAVAPGFIETDMVANLPDKTRQERLSNIRMGRAGQPDDVAGSILFLASDYSSYVTGQVLGVDGGMIV
jgi:3-oxoacyl-[acyl-carrier protein] reductase